VNAIRNGQEETDNTPHSGAPILAKDERHMEQVKSVLEHTCTAIATEVVISPASVCSILTSSLGKQKFCTKWIPQVLNND
jgi:hypothetical protein